MANEIIDINTIFGFWPRKNADISLGTLLKLMETKAVTRALTLSARGIFYDFIEGNNETFRACQNNQRLIPAATVNPCRWLNCLDEAKRVINKGVRLFRFFPQYQEWHIGDAPFSKLLDKVLGPSKVGLMIPASEGITAIGKLAENLDNPIIIEGLRYDKLAEAIVVINQTSNVYIETHIINSPDFVELLTQEVGSNHLIFGSNTPLSYIGAAIAPIEFANVSQQDKVLIFSRNLHRILGV